MKSVCFSGHRNLNQTTELKETLVNQLIKLIDEGAANFYAGGAIGWDMLCENVIIKLRAHYTYIKLHLILPCPAYEQGVKTTKQNTFGCYRRLIRWRYAQNIIAMFV